MSEHADQLLSLIDRKTARVGIIGLGYVGLPVARAFVDKGFTVVGFDIDEAKVDRLMRGESYLGHIPDAIVRSMRGAGFVATSQFERLQEPDAILVCVPTPLTETREPDLTFVNRS